MAAVSSNIGSVADYLRAIAAALDPTDPEVSEALAAPAREGIAARAADRSGPDGKWAPNVGDYARRKAAKGLDVGTGLEDESPRMLDAEQIRGEILDASAEGFTLAFGLDESVKDRGSWFTDGTKGAAPRPFFEATDEDAARTADVARAIVEKRIG